MKTNRSRYDMDVRSQYTLSICSGIGGLDLGFRLANPNSRTVCYIERELYSIGILVKAFSEGVLDEAPIWSDLQTFDCEPWRGKVDCIIGGIPCQPFSVAGKQREADDERNLWPRTAEIIAELEPGLIFIENVEGILGYYYHTIFPALQAMGYTVEAGLFSSEEVGATQVRRRLFILAVEDSDIGRWRRRSNNPERRGIADKTYPLQIAGSSGDVVRASSGRAIGSRGVESEVESVCPEWQETDAASGKSSDKLVHSYNSTRSSKQRVEQEGGQVSRSSSIQLASDDGEQSRLDGQQSRLPEGGGTGEDVQAARLFVPGPEDYEQWASLLSEVPTLKPAFCGEPDGDADDLYHAARQYRLWALGNGVVPLVAAHAYRTLATRLEVNHD